MYKLFSKQIMLILSLFLFMPFVPVQAGFWNAWFDVPEKDTQDMSKQPIQEKDEVSQGDFKKDDQDSFQEDKKEEAGQSDGYGVKKTIGLGSVVLSLGLYAYYYTKRWLAAKPTKAKLSSPVHSYFFYNYRLKDSYGDTKFWPTAKDMKAKKDDIQGTFYADLKVETRITPNNKSYTLKQINAQQEKDKHLEQKDVYVNIIQDIDTELKDIQKSIEDLSRYTNLFENVRKLLNRLKENNNFKEKLKNVQVPNRFLKIDDIYSIFLEFDQNDIENFEAKLKENFASENFLKWFGRSLFYPKYDDFMWQCWEYIKQYMRVKTYKNIIEEDYIKFIDEKKI